MGRSLIERLAGNYVLSVKSENEVDKIQAVCLGAGYAGLSEALRLSELEAKKLSGTATEAENSLRQSMIADALKRGITQLVSMHGRYRPGTIIDLEDEIRLKVGRSGKVMERLHARLNSGQENYDFLTFSKALCTYVSSYHPDRL